MFKDKVKDLRKEKNLTQDELAQHLNISRQSISKWENGNSYPTKLMINKLAEFFDIQVSDLLNNEETMLISIDNSTSIGDVKKRFVMLLSILFIILIGLLLFVWIFNNRINLIEQTQNEVVEIDPLLGYIVLDQIGLAAYDRNDEDTIYALIDSGLYPYEYLNIRGNYNSWESNKLFEKFSQGTAGRFESDGTVYILSDSETQIYHVEYICYSIENASLYLQSNSSYAFSPYLSISFTIEGTENDLFETPTFHLTLKSIDQLVDVELYQYNESNEFISNQEILVGNTIQLNSETLYFVIRETYIDEAGSSYIIKKYVNYNDFDRYFNYSFRTFSDNKFASIDTVVINTDIS